MQFVTGSNQHFRDGLLNGNLMCSVNLQIVLFAKSSICANVMRICGFITNFLPDGMTQHMEHLLKICQ